ncbi:MAG: hypothetical protein KF757_08685 [Phycisphaeraceae bacterium]|nr:hypothetical protein [Phycisphaeraceae bacterium]MCW5762830.1 hypothetical protein [Phycisphaeraceae bacterium]
MRDHRNNRVRKRSFNWSLWVRMPNAFARRARFRYFMASWFYAVLVTLPWFGTACAIPLYFDLFLPEDPGDLDLAAVEAWMAWLPLIYIAGFAASAQALL